jgi:hypothetical protein
MRGRIKVSQLIKNYEINKEKQGFIPLNYI